MAKDTADGRGYDAVKQTMKWISGFCIEKGILINSEKSNNRWGRFILIWKEKRHMKISTDMFSKKIKCDAAKVEECTKKIINYAKLQEYLAFQLYPSVIFVNGIREEEKNVWFKNSAMCSVLGITFTRSDNLRTASQNLHFSLVTWVLLISYCSLNDHKSCA